MIELIRNDWSKDFSQIKKFLLLALQDVRIEHIGSTAIPNMLSVPIVDVAIVIDNINEVPIINEKLAAIEYILQGDTGHDGCYLYSVPNNSLPKHRLYLCLSSQSWYLKNLAFNKYLLTHLDKRKEYEDLKLTSVNNLDNYEFVKTNFVNKCLKNAGYQETEFEKVYPDFNNSLINITSSIQNHFGFNSSFSTLPILDKYLKGSKHVVLLVLDGMGLDIMESNLPDDAFVRKHLVSKVTSIFPPTTVAATTALRSGLLPGVTGWVGWQQYFEKLDVNISLFRNVDYYTNEPLDSNIINEEIGFIPFATKFKHSYELFPHFVDGGFQDFNLLCNELKRITYLDEENYTYAYWDKPDALIHEYGCYNDIIKDNLHSIDEALKNISQELGPDTTLIITADHGLLDVKEIYINSFTKVTQYFVHKPSIEGRAMAFHVNDKEAFRHTFNKYFKSYFDLYSYEEFLALKLLGEEVTKAKKYLGDFIAIAKREYFINPKSVEGIFTAAHAGITKAEMLVPLIIYKS